MGTLTDKRFLMGVVAGVLLVKVVMPHVAPKLAGKL